MTDHSASVAHEQLKLAREATKIGFWQWKMDEDRCTWDDRTAELFGFSSEGGSGIQQFIETVHADDREAVKSAFDQTVQNGEPFHQRYRIQRNSNTHWLETCGTLVEQKPNAEKRFIGTVRDITQEMVEKRQLEIFKRAEDQSPYEIFVLDPETAQILDVSEQTGQALDYTRDQLLSMRLHEICPSLGDDLDWQELVERFREDGPITITTRHRRRDGTTYPVEVHADYGEIDGNQRVIATCRDISGRKQREEALHQERERFRQVAENIREVFWLTTPDKSEMIYISPAYEEIWGRSRDELYRNPKSWLDAIHDEDRERIRTALPDQRTGDYEEEYRIVRPDGEIRWIRDRAYSIQNDDGELVRVVGVAEDITERKEMEIALRKRQKLYQTLFEEANEGFLIESLDDRVLAANQSACNTLGYSRDELEGMGIGNITPPDFREQCDEKGVVQSCLNTQGTSLHNWHYVKKDGSVVPVAKSMTPVEYEGTEAVLVCMRDLSEIRQIREQDQRKSSFVTQVTHDLRTPLNSITGMGELLMDTDLTRKQTNLLKTILNASRDMERLTNDIIDLNRIERGEIILEDERFNVRNLVEDIISMYSHGQEEPEVIISSEVSEKVPEWLIGDPDRLKQILYNLMDNAIENTKQGYVQLQVERNGPENTSVPITFSVSDTGCGIPESKRETIFQPHETNVRERSVSPQGLGIGLSICKHLVEEMNGKIEVQSEPGKGATFSFTIELEKPMQQQESGPVSMDGVHVLLVEDNSLVRNVFLKYLETNDIKATECISGDQALEELMGGDTAYDVVFLDQRLTDRTGVEILKKVSETEAAIGPERVYIVSGDASERIREQLGSTPCAGILEKPVDESTLINAVQSTVQRGRREENEQVHLKNEIRNRYSRPLKILVADDDQNTRKFLNELLSPITQELTFVTNGKQAVEERFATTPDLMLMDLEMPGMNGREATERIRRKEKEQELPSIPILIHTAKAMKHVETSCLEAGADEFLRKPIRSRRLYRAILDLLR